MKNSRITHRITRIPAALLLLATLLASTPTPALAAGPVGATRAPSAQPSITATAAVNDFANAEVTPSQLALDATATTANDLTSAPTYLWSQLSGLAEGSPALLPGSRNRAKALFNAQAGGAYRFAVTATGLTTAGSVSSEATVDVRVPDRPPVARTARQIYARMTSTSQDTVLTLDSATRSTRTAPPIR